LNKLTRASSNLQFLKKWVVYILVAVMAITMIFTMFHTNEDISQHSQTVDIGTPFEADDLVKHITTKNTHSQSEVPPIRVVSSTPVQYSATKSLIYRREIESIPNIDNKIQYTLKAGSIIAGSMISGINSDLPGQIIAQVRANVYSDDHSHIIIPQGAKLIGLYDANILYGQERVAVIWHRIINPDGHSLNLQSVPGTDIQGFSGLHDLVDNKYIKIFGSSFIIGVITAAMQLSQSNTAQPGMNQTLSSSLGQQLGQTGITLANKNLTAPTLIIRPGYPFNIILTADLDIT
jgi:hypothetical protein